MCHGPTLPRVLREIRDGQVPEVMLSLKKRAVGRCGQASKREHQA